MRATLPLLLLLTATACSSDDGGTPPAAQTEEASFGHDALERARGVETTTMQHKDDLDRAIEADTSQ